MDSQNQKNGSVPIEHKKSWATVVSENLGVTSNTPHQQQVPKDAEPPATIMDTQETGENEDHDMCTAKRTALDSPEGKQPPKIRKAENPLNQDNHNHGKGPSGVPTWDLGGNGDCGFRCIAAVNAMKDNKKPKKQDIATIAEKLALTLRVKTTMFLKGDQEWRENWWPDPECNQTTEAGRPGSNLSEYLECISRPRKYLDPWLTYGAASVIKRDILVWKFNKGAWQFLARIPPASTPVSATPFCLFLKNRLHHWRGQQVQRDHEQGGHP